MTEHPRRKIIGVIPARLNSKRLPNKVLRTICGKPMLSYVYQGASRTPWLSDLVVATDSDEIYDFCNRNQMSVLMTSSQHVSGTDRVYEVATKLPADIYVNIQGDEPLIQKEHIDLLVRPFEDCDSINVTTLKTPLRTDVENVHKVKVVTDKNGDALYFSRLPIPFDQERDQKVGYYKHIGLYAYTRWALEQFHRLSPSDLERAEGLEQLRFLENGIAVRVMETSFDTIGVDTYDDLETVELHFKNKGSQI